MSSSALPALADTLNKFEDLSGVNIAAYANPYDALIEASQNDPVRNSLFCEYPFAIQQLIVL